MAAWAHELIVGSPSEAVERVHNCAKVDQGMPQSMLAHICDAVGRLPANASRIYIKTSGSWSDGNVSSSFEMRLL